MLTVREETGWGELTERWCSRNERIAAVPQPNRAEFRRRPARCFTTRRAGGIDGAFKEYCDRGPIQADSKCSGPGMATREQWDTAATTGYKNSPGHDHDR